MSKMTRKLLVFFVIFLFGAPLRAQEKDKKIEAEFQSLAKKIGAVDFDEREDATEKLIRFIFDHQDFVPKVKKLYRETKDAEVKARALYVLGKYQEALPQVRRSKVKKGSIDLGTITIPRAKVKKGPNGPIIDLGTITIPRDTIKKAPKPPARKGLPQKPLKIVPKSLKSYDFDTDLDDIFCERTDIDLGQVFEQFGVPGDFATIIEELWEGQEFNLKELIERLQNLQKRGRQLSQKQTQRQLKKRKPLYGGVGFKKPSAFAQTQLGLKPGEGLVVVEVKTGKWGFQNGIKVNDLVLTVNGQAARQAYLFDSFKEAPGSVTVLRKGKKVTLKVAKRNK